MRFRKQKWTTKRKLMSRGTSRSALARLAWTTPLLMTMLSRYRSNLTLHRTRTSRNLLKSKQIVVT